MDAIVVHSEHGAARLRDELGLDPAQVHVIPHGALDRLDVPGRRRRSLGRRTGRWCCSSACCGPTRASTCCWRPGGGRTPDAELWIVGMPRMDVVRHARAATCAPRCGSSPAPSWRARSAAADLVVLPYREIDQSGVLFTALAFGKPLLLTRRRRLPGDRPPARGARPAGRPGRAGRARSARCSADPRAARRGWPPPSRAAADGPYGWDAIAQRTLELYAGLQA